MSRGLGRVQRKIFEAFDKSEDGFFTTSELCRLVYDSENIEKKHRVAVIRSLEGLAKREMPYLWQRRLQYERADTVWYDSRRLPYKGVGRKSAVKS